MNKLALPLVALLALAACKDKPAPEGAAASASPTTTAAAKATAAPEVSCDAVVAHVETLGKMDAEGKKLFLAICKGEPASVRACMVSAKTMDALDACDPHPLGGDTKGSAAPEVKEADLVERDLSTADPAWKGWVAKGPKDAKVMADGVHGARIAANGLGAFDISFEPTKTKLADTKKGAEAGAKMMGDKAKTTFTTDTADKLEWHVDAGGTHTWYFAWNVKASGKDVTCSTGTMGADSEAMVKVLEASCQSLHKK